MSTYHDTPDLVLARHGLTFRHRVENGAGVWQLKLPQGAARIELEQPGRPARPPLELTSLLVGFLRGRELGPVARLRTRREVVLARGAEIVDDSVSVLAGARVVRRFRELEVELVDGDERTLRRSRRSCERPGPPRRSSARSSSARSSSSRPTSRRRSAATRRRGVLGARARAPGADHPDPRPGHAARLRAGGPPPDARRDAPAASVPQGRGAAPRRQLVGAAPRGARVAGRRARARARPRRARREPAGRDRGARGRRGVRRGDPRRPRERAGERARGRGRGALERPLPGAPRPARPRGLAGALGAGDPARRDLGRRVEARPQEARAARREARPTTSSTARASSSSAPATRPSSPPRSWARRGRGSGSRRRGCRTCSA